MALDLNHVLARIGMRRTHDDHEHQVKADRRRDLAGPPPGIL
jgi:hypothetical protein